MIEEQVKQVWREFRTEKPKANQDCLVTLIKFSKEGMFFKYDRATYLGDGWWESDEYDPKTWTVRRQKFTGGVSHWIPSPLAPNNWASDLSKIRPQRFESL